MFSVVPQQEKSNINPYITDVPVGESPTFIGRTDVIRDVSRALLNVNENALFLYGQRCIGKTSALQRLVIHLSKNENYHAVYFDLREKGDLPLWQVLIEFATQISQHFDMPPHATWAENAPHAFKHDFLPLALKLIPADHTLILIFDEFDVSEKPAETHASKTLFPYLRDLIAVDRKRLRYVFAIGHKPTDRTSSLIAAFKGSSLYELPLLTFEETARLIRLSERNESLLWPYETITRVQTLTGGHPFITQQLCSDVWEQTHQEPLDSTPNVHLSDVEQAVFITMKNISSTMEWIWDGLSSAEHVIVSILAEQDSESNIAPSELENLLKKHGVQVFINELQKAPRALKNWGLIEPTPSGYHFPVELQRRWFAKHKTWETVVKEVDHIQPLAESLFLTANHDYQEGNFEKAAPILKKAIRLNPNHLQANILLAEILLVQGDITQARQLLDSLYKYHPDEACPRLVQTLLLQAQSATTDEQRLTLYEQILHLEPNQPEAKSARRQIWEKRGDTALESGQLDEALDAFETASKFENKSESGLQKKTGYIKAEIGRRQFKIKLKQLEQLEKLEKYQEAYELAQELHEHYPQEKTRLPDLKKLGRRANLDKTYQEALDALERGDRLTAQELLTQVVALEPSYREATRYLHLVTTGVDMAHLRYQLQNERWARQNAEHNARLNAQKAQKYHRQQIRERWALVSGGTVFSFFIFGMCLTMIGLTSVIGYMRINPTPTPTDALVFPTPISIFTITPTLSNILYPTYTTTFTPLPIPLTREIPPTKETPPTKTPIPVDTPILTETPTQKPIPTLIDSLTTSPLPTPSDEENGGEEKETPTTELEPTTTKLEDSTDTPTPTTIPIEIARFGDNIDIIDYDVDNLPNAGGDEAHVSIDWILIREVEQNYWAEAIFLNKGPGEDGRLIPGYGEERIRLLTNKNNDGSWKVGESMNIEIDVTLKREASSGTYFIGIAVYDSETSKNPLSITINDDDDVDIGKDEEKEILLLKNFDVEN